MIDQDRRAELTEEFGEEFLSELTDAFWTDAWALIDFGVEAQINDDQVELRKVLHTLTGSAGNLGFSGISKAAEEANQALKRGVPPDFGELQKIMLRTSALISGNNEPLALSA